MYIYILEYFEAFVPTLLTHTQSKDQCFFEANSLYGVNLYYNIQFTSSCHL